MALATTHSPPSLDESQPTNTLARAAVIKQKEIPQTAYAPVGASPAGDRFLIWSGVNRLQGKLLLNRKPHMPL